MAITKKFSLSCNFPTMKSCIVPAFPSLRRHFSSLDSIYSNRFPKSRNSNLSPLASQKRFLNLHEAQSLELMAKYNVNVPRSKRVYTSKEAVEAAKEIGKDIDYVVKAQVLSGGRGLGYFKENNFKGGVHICTSLDQVESIASNMLGNTLITKQTGIQGKPCDSVLISERFYIRKERYLAILMDRMYGGPVIIGSSVGGTSIEEIAHDNPESIIRQPVSVETGLLRKEAVDFSKKLGFKDDHIEVAADNIQALYKMFTEKDCTLLEINPFSETHDGRVVMCDAKVNFDDNASFRQKELFASRDTKQEDPREVAAQKFDLNYIRLDGDIGCMVNGAGLAMATMDIIKLKGGEPANFLDVGGGADRNQVVEAFRILQNDPQVQVILVNIFGGIMRCDIIALGIIHASQEVGLTKPLVVRLEGTNQEKAKRVLDESGMRMKFTNDLEAAAESAVKMTEILKLAKTASLDVSFAM